MIRRRSGHGRPDVGTGSFGQAQLGDRRRTRRLVAVADQLACVPGGTMTGTLSTSAQIKAAYRLFDQESLTHETLCAGHWANVRAACQAPGAYLLIEDTTAVAYPSSQCPGLGPIGEDYTLGFWVHSTLAVAWRPGTSDPGNDEAEVLGLIDQQVWARDPKASRRKETKARRLARATRESTRWGRLFTEELSCPELARLIFVADREADIYETFVRCRKASVHYVVRVGQNRAVVSADDPDALLGRRIDDALAAASVRETTTLDLPAQAGRKARRATLEALAATVTIRAPWRPDGAELKDQEPVTLHLVELREVSAPAGEEPVRWVLATDLPITTLAEVWTIVAIYKRRWLIEEFHKALKSGLGLENSQLGTARKRMALAGLLSIVAAWLVGLKLQARATEMVPLRPRDADAATLAVLTHKVKVPAEGWTARSLLVSIAKLGGYLGRKGDGPPGWLTIWRGWQRLVLLAEGHRLATEKRCG